MSMEATHDNTRDIAAFLRERVVPAGASRHGLVIGIESYRDSRLNLRCAAADAKAIYDLMVDPDCGMFPKDHVKLLLNAEATREKVWHALSALRRRAGENDTAWVYYAGHAAPEESNIYWVTYDTDVDDLYGTGLSGDQISKAFNDIHAKQLLVLLDCCHAAATAMRKNPTRAVLTADEVFAHYKGHGHITLSSSDGKEKSVELSDVGHGAFTYFLEKGLRGEADQDGDGVVTADELWVYLHSRVSEASRKAGNTQTPLLIGEMTHDIALALNPIMTARKKSIAEHIAGLVGLGPENLTTDEARICLDILCRGARNQAENDVASEFDSLVRNNIRISTFKAILRTLRVEHSVSSLEETGTQSCVVTSTHSSNQGSATAEASRPRVLKVAPEDGNSYNTINAALEDAKEGDSVKISEGEYREFIRLRTGISIIGAHRDNCIVRIPDQKGARQPLIVYSS